LEALAPHQFLDLARAIEAKQGAGAPPMAATWVQTFAQEYKLDPVH
jgi:hypothetical protein